VLAGVVAVLVAVVAATVAWPGDAPDAPDDPDVTGALLVSYDGADRLVASEHRGEDPDLELTSGSLLVRDGAGWGGPPPPGDALPADEGASNAVFRARTHREDFEDVSVTFSLRNEGLDDDGDEPAHAYDGVSLGLRYQSPDDLYYVNLHRRDGVVAIKRKSASGEDDDAYTTLASTEREVPYGEWETVRVDVRTEGDAVVIEVAFDGDVVLTARDAADPILAPGRVLLRADNCRFSFDDLRIEPAPG
jgi:hypothetical protein